MRHYCIRSSRLDIASFSPFFFERADRLLKAGRAISPIHRRNTVPHLIWCQNYTSAREIMHRHRAVALRRASGFNMGNSPGSVTTSRLPDNPEQESFLYWNILVLSQSVHLLDQPSRTLEIEGERHVYTSETHRHPGKLIRSRIHALSHSRS